MEITFCGHHTRINILPAHPNQIVNQLIQFTGTNLVRYVDEVHICIIG